MPCTVLKIFCGSPQLEKTKEVAKVKKKVEVILALTVSD
jgi:hypothetical protein